MQNEYPSHIILKQEEIPSGKTNADLPNEYHTQPYLKKPEMPMSKFTKRIPILTHLENSNALMTKRIPSGLGLSYCYSNLLLTPT